MYIYFFKFICVLFISAALACGAADTSAESVAVAATSAKAVPTPSPAITKNIQTAVFAGGCFWGVEAVFEHIKGVTEVTVRLLGCERHWRNDERLVFGRA